MYVDMQIPRRQEEVCQISCYPPTLKSTGKILCLTSAVALPQACFFDLAQIIWLFFFPVFAFLLKTWELGRDWICLFILFLFMFLYSTNGKKKNLQLGLCGIKNCMQKCHKKKSQFRSVCSWKYLFSASEIQFSNTRLHTMWMCRSAALIYVPTEF